MAMLSLKLCIWQLQVKASSNLLRWAVMSSVGLSLGIMLSACIQNTPEPSPEKFKDIYEASAATQLPDGSILVLEDESKYALNLVTLDSDGKASEHKKHNKRLLKAFKRELDDLEGIAMGKDGEIYATTSFSLGKKDKRVAAREQLLRFSIQDKELISSAAYMDFGDFLRDSDIFEGLRGDNDGQKLDLDKINIEALSFDANKQQLLFGFREPLVLNKSMIVRLENPDQVLSNQAEPILSDDISLLDLSSGGIRSLVYDTRLKGYLIANEVKMKSGKLRPQLWLWSGRSDQSPQALEITAVEKMKNIEAITPVIVNGVPKVLLLSDDGERNKKKPAHYLLLDYKQLGIPE